jgi:hypothetical protein
MGVVMILAPVVVGSWPVISAAVAAAAAGLGLTVAQEVAEDNKTLQQETTSSYEMDIDNSSIGAGQLVSGKSIVLDKNGITLRVTRTERGQLKVHASGKGHSQMELKSMADEFVRKVNQCFIYNRTVTELKNKQFQMVNEEILQDGTIRLQVRQWVD